MGPMMYFNTETNKTIQLGIKMFIGQYSTEYGLVMAVSVLALIPVLLIFLIGQKQFVQGIARAVLKADKVKQKKKALLDNESVRSDCSGRAFEASQKKGVRKTMLYPRMSSGRMVFDLNGIWDFKLLEKTGTEREHAGLHLTGGRAMPVPSSYNDIYPEKDFADHVGEMAYQRTFTVTESMKKGRLVLRFGSVTHQAEVYLNGKRLGEHKGGFLPFSFEIAEQAVVGENLLTVFVNNIVDYSTLPCGRMVQKNFPGLKPRTVNLPNFDFYNYDGDYASCVAVYNACGLYQRYYGFREKSGSFA